MTVRLIRRALKGSPFYGFFADVYHFCRNAFMRMSLVFSKVKYLPPLRPNGKYHSQYGQDFHLENLGLLGKAGFFLEIGCNDPEFNSNTFYLESALDWSGVSVDALDYSAEFARLRPNTTFYQILVDEFEGQSDFYSVNNEDGWENQVSSVYEGALQLGKGFTANKVTLPTMPVRQIDKAYRPIDLCLIDVEGHEISVLKSIDWNIQKPRVILCENSGEFYPRQVLVGFLVSKGYAHVARIGSTDDIFVLEAE